MSSNSRNSQTSQENFEDDLEIFSSSLEVILSETAVTAGDPNHAVTMRGVCVYPPSTLANNWHLQADAVWKSALYLADHLPNIKGMHVLELGAGSGLPGIVAAREGGPLSVTLSDYPDPQILDTLLKNVKRNITTTSPVVTVIGHEWGQTSTRWPLEPQKEGIFDVVLAADILWMSEQHTNLALTLSQVLKQTEQARVYLVVGFHTGRWVIEKFLSVAQKFGLIVDELREVSAVDDFGERDWDAERAESEAESRKWLLLLTLKWTPSRYIIQLDSK